MERKSPPSAVETISKEELLEKLRQAEPVQLVNVLSPEHYNLGFIKGSMRIPVSELESRAQELDKDREVITYCASVDCSASSQAAEKLSAMGFDVRAYEGGLREWKESGLPMEQQ